MRSQRILIWLAFLMSSCLLRGQENNYTERFDYLFTQKHQARNIAWEGKMNFDGIVYKDTLLNYFVELDTISEDKEWYEVNAIWNADTVTCTFYKPVRFHRDMIDNKKVNFVNVESQLPPHASFRVPIDNLSEDEMKDIIDSLYQVKSDYPYLLNAPQTCISYALECLFRTNNIDPEPICYRRSMYKLMNQWDAFLDFFCVKRETYIPKKKHLKSVDFPDKSFLAFRNKDGQLIHAAFYQDRFIYSKNGIAIYLVYKNMIPLIDAYSRYGNIRYLDRSILPIAKAYTITVYTLNKELFNLN